MRNLLEASDLGSVFSALKEQISRNMEAATDGVADAYADAVRARAPSEKVIPGYKIGIKAVRNPDGTRSVVVDMPSVQKPVTVDDTVSLTFKAKNPDALKSPAWVLLKAFEPWTPRSLLVAVDPRLFETLYLRVRPDEFEALEKKQAGQRSRLSQAAQKAGLLLMKSPALQISATENIAMRVLRVEKGVSFDFAAHWTPAIRALRARMIMPNQGEFLFAKIRPQNFPPQSVSDLDSQTKFTKALV